MFKVMIDFDFDVTPYKLSTIGGEVGCGKSFILGLVSDDLLDKGKFVCFIDVDGVGKPRFDINHPNARGFMMCEYDMIVDLYEQLNKTGEELYVLIDGIGNISHGRNTMDSYMKYKMMLEKFRSYLNINTVVTWNYNKSLQNSKFSSLVPSGILMVSDYNIDVSKEIISLGDDKYTQKVLLDNEYFCTIEELLSYPEIRRMKNREKKISTLID